MSSGITNPTESDTIDKVLQNTAQLHRLLREAGLRDDARQRVIDDPAFRAELVEFWNGEQPARPNTSISVEQAYLIMGKNSHGTPALERHFGVRLSAKSKKLFTKVPFSAETLMACRETHVLVACGALSLMDLWLLHGSLFCRGSERPWFVKQDEKFAITKARAGWQLVRATPVPETYGRTWDEQISHLGVNDQVPNVSVLAQAVLIHYLETGKRLFGESYVRVSDVGSGGQQVGFGYFDISGINVPGRFWDTDRREFLYLASSVKPS